LISTKGLAMLRHKIILVSIACLVMVGWVGQTLCQTQDSSRRQSRPDFTQSREAFMEQKKKEFEKQATENKERQDRWMAERRKEFEQRARDSSNGIDQRRNELIKQTLELTEAQWKVIEPKINKVYFLRNQAGINIEISGGGGGAGGYSAGGGGSSGGSASFRGGAGSGTKSNTASGTASTETDADGWQTVRSSSGNSVSGAGGGGGSAGSGVGQMWSGPLWRLADRELTEGEKTCEELLTLLEDKNSKQQDIDQKIDALRRARDNAAKELAKARQELREVLTARQQARLVLTGLLD
jgi:hypothetical protein